MRSVLLKVMIAFCLLRYLTALDGIVSSSYRVFLTSRGHVQQSRYTHGKEGFVIPTKLFVKVGMTKIFCYNNKMFGSINKTFGCCGKVFGCSSKNIICCP